MTYIITLLIKYGIGRATYDSAHEIRNNHISLEEGKALLKNMTENFLIDTLMKLWNF